MGNIARHFLGTKENGDTTQEFRGILRWCCITATYREGIGLNQKAWNKKRAVVSGGSSGLGKFLALELARHGAEILILGRDRDRLTQVAEESRGLGASFVDTCSIDLLNDNLNELESTFFGTQQSGIDLLINAVGQSDRGYLAQLNETELIDQFRMNVLVTHRVTRLCLPQLKKAKGCVVNIGSLASKVATPCLGGYAVSKSALSAYSQQLRMELRSDGVHVLMVCLVPFSAMMEESVTITSPNKESLRNNFASLGEARPSKR